MIFLFFIYLFNKMHNHQVLVNDELKAAYEELKATAMSWYPQLQQEQGDKNCEEKKLVAPTPN